MTVLAVDFQSNWLEILQSSFMQHALIGGSLVAIAAGLLGYFVITRQNAFAAHALAHIGFPGATGAILIGAPVTLGLAVFCVVGGLLIGVAESVGGVYFGSGWKEVVVFVVFLLVLLFKPSGLFGKSRT